MNRCRKGAAALTAAVVLGFAAPAATSAGGEATVARAGLVKVLTVGKLKAKKRIAFDVTCTAKCTMSVALRLAIPGPDLGPVIVGPDTFGPESIASPYIKVEKKIVRRIRRSIRRSKLKAKITATDAATGAEQRVYRRFKFRR